VGPEFAKENERTGTNTVVRNRMMTRRRPRNGMGTKITLTIRRRTIPTRAKNGIKTKDRGRSRLAMRRAEVGTANGKEMADAGHGDRMRREFESGNGVLNHRK
jgi:hypothetical protein